VTSPRRIELLLTSRRPLPAPPLLAPHHALFLDFDGTLAEIAPRPDAVTVDRELPGILERLAQRLGGALAIVTGRRVAEIDPLLAPAVLPAAGQHGAELRPRPGGSVQLRTPAGIATLARQLIERFGADARLLIEDKGAAVALHFRQAPERALECLHAVRVLAEPWPDLEVITGKRVVEVRGRDADKGQALRALAREAPFAGRPPVFVGDDRTDEDAFAVIEAAGGYGVKVGDGPTAARYRCSGVADVRAWLRASAEAP
jgi:trehalose 6-phosphate phosphatase